MRHSEPHTAPPTQASGPSKGFDFTLMDTTSLDENGDLMKVAPPKGLFSHDLSFSVDHQAFVDESAIADMSNLDRLKQFAHGTGPGAQGAAASHGDRKNEDLPPSVLSNGNSLAIIVDVDEALGILPNRLKDAITIRISGKVMVPDVDLQSLQNTRLTVLTASECQETSTLSGGVEFQLADAARRAEEERQVRQDAELAKAREEAGRAEEERHGRQDGELAKTKAEAARVMAAQQERDTVQHDVQSVLPGSSRQQIPRNHSSDSSIVQKHTRISPSTPPVDIDNVDTPVRNPPVLLRHASAEEDAGDETVLQQDLDGLSPTATPKPAPVAMPAKDISTNSPRADGVSTSGLSSPLHAPLAPKLARAIRKHSLSRGSLGTPPPASPSVTAGSQVGSEGSGQSLGSGQKRADWLAANQASVVGLGLKGNGQGGAAGAEPLADWTMQDISTSMVGDQSLSHAALPYTVHEAKVELVPTLRNSGGKEGEEVRMVRKLICPAWPRADLEGRIVPVPNVTLIMADTDEILSVWCDHARLKWEKVEPKSDEAVELDPGVVRIRVELPASLRNARSSTDSWKLEVRVASPWSSDHATTLRAGGSVEVDIPLLDCAIGTLELHVCKPSDAWPRPVVESDGFRTQRPTDVKAYFTQDDVQSSRPLKAKISYVRDSILKAQKQSGAKISAVTILLAVVVLLLAVGIVNSANLRPSSTQRKSSYPTHLGTLARHSTLQTQTSGIMAAPSSSYGYVASQPREDGGDDSKVQDRHSDTMQNVFKTETSDIPAAKVDDRFGNIDQSVASDAGDEQNIDDADDAVADGKNYLHALDGTGQTLWQRMLDSFFGLFRRMWTP
ncbi:hypothetical protein OC846_002207 [Tilletia horrida]|uniref:Uncharacterized protein n=1 Tax=Tilletia horrida TaxID=155126 RepID=A0AAN6GUN0_9BASI|nr:hypothetical protein OC846_002207 [Tilletia horrida]KAK0564029.1 hypothetical protein OC861_004517 [Tilletia horrida]